MFTRFNTAIVIQFQHPGVIYIKTGMYQGFNIVNCSSL